MSSPKLNPVTVEFPIQLRLTDGIPIPIQEVKIEISGPQNVNGQLLRSDGAVGNARVKFVTETAGAYQVSLTTKGEHLLYSPLTINVTPKTNSKEPTPAPSLPPLPKQNVCFEVDAKNSNGEIITNEEMDLSIEVEGPEQVTPSVERIGDMLRITFEVEAAKGTYEIAVFQNGVHIQRSPFTVELGRSSTINSDKKDSNIPKLPALPPSRTIQFRVPAQSSDGKEIKAKDTVGKVTSGQEEDGNVKIVDSGKELLVSFEAYHPGPFEISVSKISDQKQLLGSPFDVDVPPEAFSNRR